LVAATNYTARSWPSMPDSDPSEHPRVTLPTNLSETLKRLEDAELVTLLREVTTEAERRGVLKPVNAVATPRISSKYQARQSKSSGASADLPAGKANLIKASHSAGMKPAAIARMFRLSQSVVNQVLSLPAKSKK
jgi:hypothetical protein